ncbi:MAG: DUF3179 domain-containing protein [bacterium]
MKSRTFWPQGRELFLCLSLIAAILMCGYFTYCHVATRIESECRMLSASKSTALASMTFNLSKTSIPVNKIYHGGPPKDGIPALTHPRMLAAAEADYLDPDDRVIGVRVEGEARAYPLRIMAWHECVNDTIGDHPFVVTYCPLCDSTMVFDRRVSGDVLEFGVSGFLYQSNLLFYNRRAKNEEESLWCQLLGKAVTGPMTEIPLRTLDHQLVTWEQWRERYPSTRVLSLDTGHKRNYDKKYHAEYFAQPGLYYPVDQTKNLFDLKEPVLGIRVGTAGKAYPFRRFETQANPIQDSLNGIPITIERLEDGQVIVEHGEGAEVVHSFWFAWYAFDPETAVYDGAGFDLAAWMKSRSRNESGRTTHLR